MPLPVIKAETAQRRPQRGLVQSAVGTAVVVTRPTAEADNCGAAARSEWRVGVQVGCAGGVGLRQLEQV